MVTYSFYEGDTRVMRYAETLVERGDQVDVMALRGDDQSPRELVNGVNILRVQRRSHNSGGKIFYLYGILLFFLHVMVLLTLRHLKNRYQLIHVHSVPDFLVFTAWIPKLMGAKIILDIHDLLPEFYASKYSAKHDSLVFNLLLWTERVSGFLADHVISANDLWQEKLILRSLKKWKCTSLVNFADRALFFRQGRTRTDGKFIILYPGTLNWHQGLDIAIRAFYRIKDEVPEAEFHIYGEGPVRPALMQLIQELGLQNRVFVKSYVPTRAIVRVIENADLGVIPKRKDGFGNEAFSTKIMEFMAMGVPVVVSDTKVDRYYFNDSVVKFFRGGDEDDLAQSMLLLITQPDLRARLVQNACEFVKRNDWNMMKPKYLALVDSLVGQGPHAGKEEFMPSIVVLPSALPFFRNFHDLLLILAGCIALSVAVAVVRFLLITGNLVQLD